MKFLLLVLATAFAVQAYDFDIYKGSELVHVFPKNTEHHQFLSKLQDHYDYWTPPTTTGIPGTIFAHEKDVSTLKRTLRNAGIEFEVLDVDVGELLTKNHELNEAARAKAGAEMEWTSYHSYDEMMAWLEKMAGDYPNLVTVSDVGQSYEGRTMKIVKVSTGGPDKPSIFMDGGMHAREWISPAATTYMMNELVVNSDVYQSTLDKVDFYFMPNINPDGYEYSQLTDRMWRKTRSPTKNENCIGTDPNRNWDFHWAEAGSSNLACSEAYHGASAFSEVEMQHVRDQIALHNDTGVIYLTMHSFSQFYLYPWGYGANKPADNAAAMQSLGDASAAALTAVHKTTYTVGSSDDVYGAAAGASDDYSKGALFYEYAYTIELRDTGKYGFILPADQIIPTGEETFEGFRVFFEFVRDERS